MSKAYKCDICKNFFEEKSENRTINITIRRYDQTHFVDICDSCYHDIEDLIFGNAKAKNHLHDDNFGLFEKRCNDQT